MPQNDAMTELLERLRRNATPLGQNYDSANELLGVAVGRGLSLGAGSACGAR